MSERNVPVEILLDTTVNGTKYTKGQQGATMTAMEARVSVRDKAARIIITDSPAAPQPRHADPSPAPAKPATKRARKSGAATKKSGTAKKAKRA